MKIIYNLSLGQQGYSYVIAGISTIILGIIRWLFIGETDFFPMGLGILLGGLIFLYIHDQKMVKK